MKPVSMFKAGDLVLYSNYGEERGLVLKIDDAWITVLWFEPEAHQASIIEIYNVRFLDKNFKKI